MAKSEPISIESASRTLTFVGDRTPESTDMEQAFCMLSEYRDGGVFLTHYAGTSEWERHTKGDELVFVVEGEAALFLLVDGEEKHNLLRQGELLVVLQNTWHRFEAPEAVKVLTITPQPTDHSVAPPVLDD